MSLDFRLTAWECAPNENSLGYICTNLFLSCSSYRNFFENRVSGLVRNSGSLSDFWSPGYMWPGTDLFSVGPELDIAVTGIPWETDHLYLLRFCLLPSIGQWVGSVSHPCHHQIYDCPDFPELLYGDHLLDDICPCLNLVIVETRIY